MLNGGRVGFEYDFSYTSDFFPATRIFKDNRVLTSMFNVIVGHPIGGGAEFGPSFRPYGSAGIGLITTSLEDGNDNLQFRDNDLGFNVGGGLMGFVNDKVGFRGDFRYFRNASETDAQDEFDVATAGFDWWRVTAGFIFRY